MVALLFYYENLSLQEIADRLCISLSAVKNRLLKGREQLRAQLHVIYPEIALRPQRKRKGNNMLKMTVARELIPDNRKLVILADERQQFALPLWLGMVDGKARGNIYNTRLQEQNALEPLTSDLLTNILQAVNGKLESVTIEILQDDILYATLSLTGQMGQSKVKARIAEALTLAISMHCAIYAATDVLELVGQRLNEQQGETFEQQLDALASMISKSSYMAQGAQTPILTKSPRNVDFSVGLSAWSFMGHPREAFTHYLDKEVTRNGKASFSIIGQDVELAAAILYHEGFQADDYRGKRLRMRVYARTKDMKLGSFALQSHGPNRKIATSSRAKSLQGTQDWTLSTLVLDVPPDSNYINFSFNTMGMGQIWLDAIQFDVVDTSVPCTETGHDWPPPLEPQNIHFEHGLQHWDLWGSYPQDYERGTERNDYAEGIVSGYLKAGVPTARGTGILRQNIRAKEYQGKRIRWSGLVKTKDVELQAGLYLQLDGPGINDMMEKTLSRTTDWKEYAVEIYVPTDCLQLRFGLILYGQGQVWLAKARLETLD